MLVLDLSRVSSEDGGVIVLLVWLAVPKAGGDITSVARYLVQPVTKDVMVR